MSILQKCMDSARTMPTNTRMTLTKTARPCATEESDTVVRPLSLATALAPCSAPSPSPSESNDPKAENVPNVLFATNTERSIHRGAREVRRARRTDETKNEAQRDGRSSRLGRRALTKTGTTKAAAVSMIWSMMGTHFPTVSSTVIAHQKQRLGQDVMIHFIVSSRFRYSGWILPARPIRAMVRNGDMPELPASVNEKAVLATYLITLLMLLCCGPGVTITNSSLDAKKMMMLFTNIAEFPNIREFRLPSDTRHKHNVA